MPAHVDTFAEVAPRQTHHGHVLRTPQLHPSVRMIPTFEDFEASGGELGSVGGVQQRCLGIIPLCTLPEKVRIHLLLQ